MSEENTIEDPNEEKSFLRVIVHSFFIIPFLIAVFCMLLFAGIHLLTTEKRTVYDYLEDVKTGGLNKRWQGAFELSKILANPKLLPNDERFSNEMISAFEKSIHDDSRVRQYLALAMGRTQRREFTPVLMEALPQERDESAASLIYALGMLQEKKAAKVIQPFTSHPDARIRSVAIVALGNIGSLESVQYLKKGLQDQEPNVQWGSAISLAKMGNLSGKQILLKLMDHDYFTQYPEVDAQEEKYLRLAAIDAASQFDDTDISNKLKNLSTNDPSMKVRSAALEILNK